ncbi:MarR family winged helix-turn-helix transcriptional regulator [Actinomadura sp. 21ATH]|uniref:MarR family winged helix-turn-helix transcriptional regulator n=1 Tax=Actinomadura sp. 21ATH TaxID=1735444 RepID=UPI0035BF95AD
MSTSTDECAEALVDGLERGVRDRWESNALSGSPWPFLSITALGRVYQFLNKALEDELKRFGLSKPGYYVLTTLALTTQGRARLSTLSRLVLMHATSVKLTVDQLESAGLVERGPHPHDRRVTLVFITDAGRARVDEVHEALDAPEGELAAFGGLHKDIFHAMQPARAAAGDMAFSPNDRML